MSRGKLFHYTLIEKCAQFNFIYGHILGDTIARIQKNNSRSARYIQRYHSLNGYIHFRGFEVSKHDLQHWSAHSLAASNEHLFGFMHP